MEQKQAIEALVERILAAKQADPTADVQPLEPQIDHLVYHLTPEEIAIVERCKGDRFRVKGYAHAISSGLPTSLIVRLGTVCV